MGSGERKEVGVDGQWPMRSGTRDRSPRPFIGGRWPCKSSVN